MKIFAVLILTISAWAQVADDANKGYKTKEGRDKVAATLEDPHRDARQKPQELVAAMNIKPGMTVADIGTGTGYMLKFLSDAVGPTGKVYGEDIQTDFLDRARAKNVPNTELILGTTTDPKLPPNSVDIALVLDVYHHFDYPDKMLAAIRSGLKPGAHLVIVDFYKSASPSPGHIRLERDEVAAEIQRNGFHLLSQRDHIPKSQYMLTFEKSR
ncbi:MAG TPA: methyltransferase domain-containing protein [Bryobacteraceae bacterium]|jgi:ubiquinone/menaquinone biosynthesis C-methylase UbiE|nr:methyltransferase domain-containing protein [Bryobacteraceae bacterium]